MAKDILKNELFESFANASDNIYIYVCVFCLMCVGTQGAQHRALDPLQLQL